ncbi:MAG TPA: hypothetical protein VEM93_10625, partial [Actinomycetota bacterium]|nr:hypothetical protein [Actinomycetota bacterium]
MTDRALLRGSIALAAVAALLVLSALALSPSPSATHDGPNGTAVLKQMLTELGVRVSEADLPPEPPGAFVLLEDLRTA